MATDQHIIASIANDAKLGRRFVFMLGAGLSVPSGIPSTRGLQRLLNLYIRRVFDERDPWDPRSDPWPDVGALLKRPEYRRSLQDELNELIATEPDRQKVRLYRMALGRAEDWKDSLQFLSQFVRTARRLPALSDVDSSVIDHFFRTLVEERAPCLGHRMLVSLASALDVNLVLTTNFDDLIEDAFRKAEQSLAVYEIPRNAPLPSARLVCMRRSLVKLHGGRFALRADMTVDAPVNSDDKVTLLEYLTGAKQDTSSDLENCRLIVGGISASDKRIVDLIDHALSSRIRIYWLCFSPDDLKEMQLLFNQPQKRAFLSIARVTDLGLFLLEVYQRCVGCLPPSVLVFPSVWNIPFPPRLAIPSTQRERPSEYQSLINEVRKTVHFLIGLTNDDKPDCQKGKETSLFGVLPIRLKPQCYGAATVASEIFDELAGKAQRIWLDADDITQPVGIFLRLVLAMRQMTGATEPLTSLHLEDYYQPRTEATYQRFKRVLAAELSRIVNHSLSEWFIVLNGVESLGSSPSFYDPDSQERWSDQENLRKVWDCFDFIAPQLTRRVCVVVISGGQLHAFGRVKELCVTRGAVLKRSCIPFVPSTIVLKAIADIKSVPPGAAIRDTKGLVFAYILTIFRMARYESVIIRVFHEWERTENRSDSVTPAAEIRGWLTQMAESHVLRFKPGGIIWMNQTIREQLRAALEDRLISRGQRVAINALIARSYGRILLASSDPLAGFESLQHMMQAVETAFRSPALFPRALSAMKHAEQVFDITSGHLQQRLTEQFARACLGTLQTRLEHWLQRKWLARPDASELKAAAFRIYGRVVRARLRTTEIQGPLAEFAKVTAETLAFLQKNCTRLEDVKRSVLLYRAVSEIKSRRYSLARKDLNDLWRQTFGPQPPLAGGSNLDEILQDCRKKYLEKACPVENTEIAIQIIRRHVYLLLHEAQVQYLKTRGPHHPENEVDYLPKLQMAEKIADFGFELLRSISAEGRAFLFYENARLRAHVALLVGRLGTQASFGTATRHATWFLRAESFLTDAQAFVNNYSGGNDTLTGGVIELRRAEVYLQRAASVPDFRSARERIRYQVDMGAIKIEHLNTAFAGDDQEAISPCLEAVAFVDKAWNALHRANAFLSQHKKSYWWRQLQMVLIVKCCEYETTLSFLAPGLKTHAQTFAESSYIRRAEAMLAAVKELAAEIPDMDGFQARRMLDAVRVINYIVRIQPNPSQISESFLEFEKSLLTSVDAWLKGSGSNSDETVREYVANGLDKIRTAPAREAVAGSTSVNANEI
ncbi:MAG: SIR2 family protein [Verrucomicrobiota bacterium]